MINFFRNKASWIVGLLILAFVSPYIIDWFGLRKPQVQVAPSATVSKPKAPDIQVSVPTFSADSAYMYADRQVSFGPRVPGSPAHKKAAAWFSQTFKSRGLQVIEQPFQAPNYKGGTWNGVNIIAQYKPQQTRRILIGAHWDSRFMADKDTQDKLKPILGADDGASGVAVILELARLLQQTPVDIGVDFVLFDVEDQGDDNGNNSESWCLGAQHWSKNLHTAGYTPYYAILLDMVGAKGAQFKKEGVSMEVAPRLVDRIWDLAASMGYDRYFIPQTIQGITDDHYFVVRNARIPMINIVSTPNAGGSDTKLFGDHHHRHSDNLSVLDRDVLKAVGQVMATVIYQTYNTGGAL